MTKHSTFLLAALSTFALAAPAVAQPYTRDHRAPRTEQSAIRDHRRPQVRPLNPTFAAPAPTIAAYAPKSGPSGTIVTIMGRNFEAGTFVNYGGKIVAPTSISSRRIVFEIPAGGRDGMISVLGRNSRRSTVVGSFDVFVPRPSRPDWRVRFDREETERIRSRGSRRAKRVRSYEGRWRSTFLASPAARAELSLHAQRTAKLERMKRLASARRNAALVRRINTALNRENVRHERQLKKLEGRFYA